MKKIKKEHKNPWHKQYTTGVSSCCTHSIASFPIFVNSLQKNFHTIIYFIYNIQQTANKLQKRGLQILTVFLLYGTIN